MSAGKIPTDIVSLAKIYAAKFPGDRASYAIAQWALETGWGTSDIWRENLNPFGIKVAKDNRYQEGENRGHATYRTLANAFRDRLRILTFYRNSMAKGNPGLQADVMAMLDAWWAPEQQYQEKLGRLIEDYNLEEYDTEIPPQREDLRPSEPVKPATDPRDSWKDPRETGKKGSAGIAGLILSVATTLAGGSLGLPARLGVTIGSRIVSGLLGWWIKKKFGPVLDAVLQVEEEIPEPKAGRRKEERALEVIGVSDPDSAVGELVRAGIRGTVDTLKAEWGADFRARVAEIRADLRI